MAVADQTIPVAFAEALGPNRDANSSGQIPELLR